MQIRGEYWINNGSIEYADEDAEMNHEGHALYHIGQEFLPGLLDLAEEFEIPTEGLEYNFDYEKFHTILYQVYYALEDQDKNARQVIMQALNANQDTMRVFFDKKDPRTYVMKYDGWIAVRGNNVELYGFDDRKRKNLYNGINDILDEENDYEVDTTDLEINIQDYKTNSNRYVSFSDLENPQAIRPAQPNAVNTNKGDRRFTPTSKDNVENIPNNIKSNPNLLNVAAQKTGIVGPGQQLWRGTSESFKNWLEHNA